VHKKSSTFSKKPSSYYIEDDEVLFPTDIGIDISGTRDWD
jgi:hypothetical protein